MKKLAPQYVVVDRQDAGGVHSVVNAPYDSSILQSLSRRGVFSYGLSAFCTSRQNFAKPKKKGKEQGIFVQEQEIIVLR